MLRILKRLFQKGVAPQGEWVSRTPINRKPLSKKGADPSQKRASITLDSPACPYCGVIQDPPPTRRRKCRDCGEVIHTYTDRKKRKKFLLTADGAERRKQEEARLKAAEQAKAERRAKRKRDATWKELSRQIQSAMRRGDWQALSWAYYGQADILETEGRPYQHVRDEAVKAAQQSKRQKLQEYMELGIRKVRVSTVRDGRVCDECAALEGRVFTVAEALKKMPLPGLECDEGRCRCDYSATFS